MTSVDRLRGAAAAVLGVLLPALQATAQTSPPSAAEPSSLPASACVAVVLPSASGVAGDATAFSTSLRGLMVSYLQGPALRTLELEARLPAQAIAEARQKDCPHVLVLSVERKHDDGGGAWRSVLGRAAGTAVATGLPYGTSPGTAAIRGAAIASSQAVSTMAVSTRAKDAVTLTFRLGTFDAALRARPVSQSARASRDGEDVLTPLVERAAESIVSAVLQK